MEKSRKDEDAGWVRADNARRGGLLATRLRTLEC